MSRIGLPHSLLDCCALRHVTAAARKLRLFIRTYRTMELPSLTSRVAIPGGDDLSGSRPPSLGGTMDELSRRSILRRSPGLAGYTAAALAMPQAKRPEPDRKLRVVA